MMEITKLEMTRPQLAEKHFYYNGCEYADISAKNEEEENTVLNLAVDVLIQILAEEYKENV